MKHPQPPRSDHTIHTIAIASGKGGVGKTHITVSLAALMASLGHRVLVIDADLGLANADLLLDVRPEYGLKHVVSGRVPIEAALTESPLGVTLLPGLTDTSEDLQLDSSEKLALLAALGSIAPRFDLALVDTAGGIGDTGLFFCQGADEVLLVTSPEPTSLADTYALARALVKRARQTRLSLVVNQCVNERVARAVHERLANLCERFFDLPLPLSGWLPLDAAVCAAVMRRTPVVCASPGAPATQRLHHLAERLGRSERAPWPRSGLSLFVKPAPQAAEPRGIVDPYSDPDHCRGDVLEGGPHLAPGQA